MKPIGPTTRSGGFEAKRGYVARAGRALELADEQAKRITRLQGAAGAANRGDVVPRGEYGDLHLFAEAATVFAAMAVESFLNLYGVIRLGEESFQKHYERLGLSAKTAAVVASCCSIVLEVDDEIVSVVSRLSSTRNALVHPKAKELRPGQARSGQTTPHERATGALEDAMRFFALFVALDPEAADLAAGA